MLMKPIGYGTAMTPPGHVRQQPVPNRFGCGRDFTPKPDKSQGRWAGFDFKEELRFYKKALWGLVKLPVLPYVLTRELTKPRTLENINPVMAPVKANLYHHVDVLTRMDRSYKNPVGLKAASQYIENQWKALGQEVEHQRFFCPHGEAENLITSFGPKDAPRIVVGAHYDVCVTEVPDGKFKPGADDNASAVAGMLELSRMLKQNAPKLKYRVDLVAFANEEPPYFRSPHMGSAVHAKVLKDMNAEVKAMYSLDMIGYYSDEPGSQKYPAVLRPFYEDKGNFIGMFGEWDSLNLLKKSKAGVMQHSNIPVQTMSAPSFIKGVDYSDHLNYSRYGWPAIMVTDTALYRNPNYHHATDTIQTLNFDKMSEVVQGLYGVVTNF